MSNGFFRFDATGRVAYRLHVADFRNSVTDELYPVPENFTNDSEYALIDGVVTHVGPIPSPNHEWDGKGYVLNMAKAEEVVREHRDMLLSVCDWTQLPDVPDATKSAWAQYRQLLRDVTLQPGFPLNVTWPDRP